ncbi:hypothetical protein G3N59_26595 [Paraburkholderia sp. Ac-20340]|uniref:hypothetical protein n=1 Tax=Paraburkholderia sp. Ac-20340 TaxID=2703888 RepID=UPI0019804CB9|nr:hypothetical protein [Paraburkholderia sp. Ac-20340]MBN3856953.1 hypothetical protein [Paraburkholderia sp. Ac-20340]
MANDLVKSEIKKRVRSFWDTKEGGVGMVVGVAALGGLVWGAGKVMPYIARLMENTAAAVFFGAIAVGLVYVLVFDSTLRSRLWLAYQLLMKGLTYSIIKYDPAATERILSKEINKMIDEASDARVKGGGRVEAVRKTIDDFKEEQEQLKREAMAMARKHRPQEEINSHARRIGQLDAAIQRTGKVYDELNATYNNLVDAETAFRRMHDEAEFKIRLKVKEYEAVNSMTEAWRGFRRAFSRTTTVNELRDMLVDYINDDSAAKMGEMRAYVQDSVKVIDAVQIRDDVDTERGLQLLADLNSRQIDFTPAARLTDPAHGSPTSAGQSQPPAPGPIDYTRYKN